MLPSFVVLGAVFPRGQCFGLPDIEKQLAHLLIAVRLSHAPSSRWNTDKYAEVLMRIEAEREVDLDPNCAAAMKSGGLGLARP